MNYLLILFQLLSLSFLIASCSSQTKTESMNHEGVLITNETNPNQTPLTIDDEAIKPTESTEPVFEYKRENKEIKILIGPGCYQAFAMTGFLKAIERNRIKITEISGIETGALVAALYAKYKKSSVVEWHLFKFMQSPFSSLTIGSLAWKNQLYQFLKNHFDQMKIEELKNLRILLCKENQLCSYIENGDLVSALWESLNQKENFNLSRQDLEEIVLINHLKNKKIKIDEWYDYAKVDSNLQKLKRNDGFRYFEVELNKSKELCHPLEWQRSLADTQLFGNQVVKKIKEQEVK